MHSNAVSLGALSLLVLGTQPAFAAAAEDDAGAAIVVNGQRLNDHREADALKTGTVLRDTPQSVTVVTRQQLDEQGIDQLGDALRYVPGVSLGQGEGHRDQILLRGQSTTADFFIDGLRDDAQYYRPLYNIERVEVLKGANALLFGRGGGGGVINRVAKHAIPGSTVGAAAGSVDTWGAWSLASDANLSLGQNAALRFNATYEEFKSHRQLYGGNFTGLSPNVTVQLGDATVLKLEYTFDRDRRLTDRGIPSRFGVPIVGYDRTQFGSDRLNRSRVDAHIARARIEHDFGTGLSVNLAGQFADYDKYYGNIVPGATTATTVSLSGYASATQRRNWLGQAYALWKGATGGINHTLLAGIEAGNQRTLSNRQEALFAKPGGGTALSAVVPLTETLILPAISWSAINRASRSSVETVSFFAQDQIEFTPWLQVIAGVRRDNFSIASLDQIKGVTTGRSDGKWSPRLGLVLKPRREVSVYVSFARSFLPQSGDQFTTLDATQATLAPESFRNLEAGVKWDIIPTLSFTAALFEVLRDNTRANDPLTGNPVLTGKSRVRGFEAGLAGQILPQWRVSLGYSYQDGEILATTTAAPAGRRLDKLPRHQASAWTRYNLSERFGLALGLTHQSMQFASISNTVRLPGFTRVDAAAFFDISDRIALQMNVENLTDTRYFPSAHTDNNIATGEPFNARLTVRVKL